VQRVDIPQSTCEDWCAPNNTPMYSRTLPHNLNIAWHTPASNTQVLEAIERIVAACTQVPTSMTATTKPKNTDAIWPWTSCPPQWPWMTLGATVSRDLSTTEIDGTHDRGAVQTTRTKNAKPQKKIQCGHLHVDAARTRVYGRGGAQVLKENFRFQGLMQPKDRP